MNAIPDPSDFDTIDDELEDAMSSMLTPADEVEIIASGHREIIAKRSQRIADRKKASKEFLTACEAEIARIRTVMAEHKAKAAEDNASDKQVIAMSRAALATVE